MFGFKRKVQERALISTYARNVQEQISAELLARAYRDILGAVQHRELHAVTYIPDAYPAKSKVCLARYLRKLGFSAGYGEVSSTVMVDLVHSSDKAIIGIQRHMLKGIDGPSIFD